MEQYIYYFIDCWKKAFNCKEKGSRAEFASFVVITLIITVFLHTLETFIKNFMVEYQDPWSVLRFTEGYTMNGLTLTYVVWALSTSASVYLVISLVPLVAAIARRFQDLKRSKWWAAFFFAPIILFPTLIFIAFSIQNKILTTGSLIFMLIYFLYGLFLVLKLLFQQGEEEEEEANNSTENAQNLN